MRHAAVTSGRYDHRLRGALLDHGGDPRLLATALLDQMKAQRVQLVVAQLACGVVDDLGRRLGVGRQEVQRACKERAGILPPPKAGGSSEAASATHAV